MLVYVVVQLTKVAGVVILSMWDVQLNLADVTTPIRTVQQAFPLLITYICICVTVRDDAAA